jgi:transposase-like protein
VSVISKTNSNNKRGITPDNVVETPDIRDAVLPADGEEGEVLPAVVTEERQYDITQLPIKMQRFVHLYTTGQYTLAKLSQLLEVHPYTLGNWLKRKDVKTIILDMQNTTHDIVNMQLKALTLSAVSKLTNLINSPIDGVALQAVKDVLDRGGHKPKQEVKIDKTVKTFEQKLNSIIDSTIIDVEFEESEEI